MLLKKGGKRKAGERGKAKNKQGGKRKRGVRKFFFQRYFFLCRYNQFFPTTPCSFLCQFHFPFCLCRFAPFSVFRTSIDIATNILGLIASKAGIYFLENAITERKEESNILKCLRGLQGRNSRVYQNVLNGLINGPLVPLFFFREMRPVAY